MQKVYLLLRNNQQTGPHSFEELLRLQLKPNDLIWIEGKSYGWRYPAEVENLKPYLPTTDAPRKETEQIPPPNPQPCKIDTGSQKKVFVSMPLNPQAGSKEDVVSIDPIEQKAEELRKRAQAYTPQQEETKINYSRNVNDAEEEYTNWLYQQKTKKKSKLPGRTLVIASIGAFVILSGWWMKGHFFDQASTGNPISIQDKKIPEEDITTPVDPASEEKFALNEEMKPKTEKTKKEKPKEQITDKLIVQKDISTTKSVSLSDEQIVDQTPVIKNEDENTETLVQAPEEKKKTLKEKINDLFKNKKETEPVEEPQSVENANNERKATKREDENVTTTITDISDQVEIKTNKIADSWMMGVKNVKLILYNKSNLTLNHAKVEVLYYSDQNILLEKKSISYTNIPPKKSQTLSIPDNRLADHIGYKVVSATGVENAYANR